jgi:glutamyl/glutaminyl-tRNA synthetase
MFITRFAPAPTGLLHLGHVVNALYVWGMVRAASGTVLLRIEDHDRVRSRLEFERAILEDLEWLGLVPDAAPVRQSDRSATYEAALNTLQSKSLVYACECSRRDVEVKAGSGFRIRPDMGSSLSRIADTERGYPGTCASKNLAWSDRLGLRVRLAPSIQAFNDLRHGPQEQCPAEQCGDLLARDREGNWTYQFAATVDDFVQGVTMVVRGDDLLASTGRQIQLARLLGRTTPPTFLHHPLIMKTPTQKLSKADRDTGIRDLRQQGWTAHRVRGLAAAAAGLIDRPRDLSIDEAVDVVAELPLACAARLRQSI